MNSEEDKNLNDNFFQDIEDSSVLPETESDEELEEVQAETPTQSSSRELVDTVIDEAGSQALQKLGVPKGAADKVVKKGGGFFSPNNLPANKLMKERTRSAIANRLDQANDLKEKLNKSHSTFISMQNAKQVENETAKQMAKTNPTESTKQTIKNSGASENVKQQLGNELIKKLLTKKTLIITIGISLFMILLILIITVVLTRAEGDQSEINTSPEVIGIVTGEKDFSEVTDYLVYIGICRELKDKTEERQECEASGYGQYLLYFKSVYEQYQNKTDKYNNPIKLDIPLILETISYNRNDTTLNEVLLAENTAVSNQTISKNAIYTEVDNLAEALVEEIEEYGDLYYMNDYGHCSVRENVSYKTYYRISDDKYVSYLKFGKVHENYQGKPRKYDVDVHPDSTASCIPDGHYYNPPSDIRYSSGIDNSIDNDNNSSTPSTPSGNSLGQQIADYALQFVGNKYKFGGSNPNVSDWSIDDGIDCSGFTKYVMNHFGISLNRHSLDQAKNGTAVASISEAQPGDLIVYSPNDGQGHVAIYIGNNKIVHASSAKTGIKVSNRANYRAILAIRRFT